MAFFVGGQIFLALVVLICTGVALASHLELWDSPTLQAKLGLLGVVFVLSLARLARPRAHVLQAAVLLCTLTIVYLGLELAT
jgi:uncharacterized membrane protein YdcZ (DUF606 family)